MSAVVIGGGLRLRLTFFCTGSLPGHVAWIVMELSRFFFTRLLLIRVFIVAHGTLLSLFAAIALAFEGRKWSAENLVLGCSNRSVSGATLQGKVRSFAKQARRVTSQNFCANRSRRHCDQLERCLQVTFQLRRRLSPLIHRRAISNHGLCKFRHAASRSLDRDVTEMSNVTISLKEVQVIENPY
jgi:hypothetical protein